MSKFFKIVVSVIIMCILVALFDAWLLQCVYNFGISPILSIYNINVPNITYSVFLLAVVSISLFRLDKVNSYKTTSIMDAIANIIGIIVTKLIYVFVLYSIYVLLF